MDVLPAANFNFRSDASDAEKYQLGKATENESVPMFVSEFSAGNCEYVTMIPTNHELYQQARKAMDAGQFETAVALFQQSIDASPHFKSLELLGECLIALGRLQEAIVPLAAATTLNNGVRAPALLADVFWNLRQRTDAERIVEIALARDPDNKKAKMVKEALTAEEAVAFGSSEVRRLTYQPIQPEQYELVRRFLAENGWAKRVADVERFAKMMQAAGRTVVVWDNKRVVGLGRALCDGVSNGYLSMIAVAEDKRGQGIGRELVERLMGEDPEITWVLRAGHGSIDFWRKMGFAPSTIAMERTRPSNETAAAEKKVW